MAGGETHELGNPGGGGGGSEQVTLHTAPGGGLAGGHWSPRGAGRVPELPRTDRTVPIQATAAHTHLESLAGTAAAVIKLADATTGRKRETHDVTPNAARLRKR